ncbi:MAG: anthranilate synthase component I [Deltaproteobacteria bacterium]|nr:anthranilate synthase component I [Deltaproteobacteria bacterium]MBW2360301.1 anthranilate synthase component I [Deltaproteobacteria bacterium]
MLSPSQDVFEELAQRGNLVPVVREVVVDLDTPLSLFRRLDDGHTAFLFESVEGGERWARFSFIGVGSRAVFRARGGSVEWSEDGDTERFEVDGDPLEILRDKLAELRVAQPEGMALPPFVGGAVGMVAYDWVRFVEQLPDDNPDEARLPDLWFSLPETVVAFDNHRQVALVVRHVRVTPGADASALYRAACADLERVVQQIRTPLTEAPGDEVVRAPMDLQRSMSQEAYREIVKRAKEYIEAGDVFQVVLSQQYRIPLQVDPFTIYRHLRRINPSPYLFFVRCEGPVLIGSSPEIHVRLEDGRIDLRPIAGTRPRGRTPEEDRALEEELRADPKENAEHLMLVDLGRNDVGRVAEIGSVNVNEYGIVERYSHVMHLVSNVQGRLRQGCDWLDVLRATFPAGTLSGAPKVRAMEIIDELETLRRGFYGGCIGYVDYSGNMDTAIAIRTMLVKDGELFLRTGAGVVADSDPELEFQECENKARALVQAIDMAREGID